MGLFFGWEQKRVMIESGARQIKAVETEQWNDNNVKGENISLLFSFDGYF